MLGVTSPGIILANCITRYFEEITHREIRFLRKARSARSHYQELRRSAEKRLFPWQFVCCRSEIFVSGALAIATDTVQRAKRAFEEEFLKDSDSEGEGEYAAVVVVAEKGTKRKSRSRFLRKRFRRVKDLVEARARRFIT